MAGNLAINKVTNCNVFLDGNSLLGRAKDVTLPQLKQKMTPFEGLGLYGSPEFPSGLELMEVKFEWTAFYEEVMRQCSNPFRAMNIQVRASVEVWNSQGRSDEIPLVSSLTGTWKTFPGGKIERHDKGTWDSEFAASYIKTMFDGVDVYEIDVLANIYTVNGVDLLANFRRNLGV